MSAADLTFKNNILYIEDNSGNLLPVAIALPEFKLVMESLTVYRDVCKDTDLDAMREMQKNGVTFKSAWHQTVQEQVGRHLKNMLEPFGFEVMSVEQFLQEEAGNVQKH